MSEFFEQENEQGNQDSNGVKQLRQQYEAMKQEVARLQADARKRQVEDLLPAGVNRKVASLYQGEPDGFKDWFEANKDLFAAQAPASAEQEKTEAPATTGSPNIEDQVRAAMERTGEGETGTMDPSAFASELEKANSVFAKHGTDFEGAIAELQGRATYGF